MKNNNFWRNIEYFKYWGLMTHITNDFSSKFFSIKPTRIPLFSKCFHFWEPAILLVLSLQRDWDFSLLACHVMGVRYQISTFFILLHLLSILLSKYPTIFHLSLVIGGFDSFVLQLMYSLLATCRAQLLWLSSFYPYFCW